MFLFEEQLNCGVIYHLFNSDMAGIL